MGGRVTVPGVEGDRLRATREEDLRRRARPCESAVDGQEIGQVLAEEAPRPPGLALEGGIVAQRERLKPAGQRDQPLRVEPHLRLAEAGAGPLDEVAQLVRWGDARQEGGRLADALAAPDGPVEELVDLGLDPGGLDGRVAEQGHALLEGERPLELQAGQRPLLVEHLTRHREPGVSRQIEQRGRPARRARQGREPRPGLGGQREHGEEAAVQRRGLRPSVVQPSGRNVAPSGPPGHGGPRRRGTTVAAPDSPG